MKVNRIAMPLIGWEREYNHFNAALLLRRLAPRAEVIIGGVQVTHRDYPLLYLVISSHAYRPSLGVASVMHSKG